MTEKEKKSSPEYHSRHIRYANVYPKHFNGIKPQERRGTYGFDSHFPSSEITNLITV
jgi:hypothetical protein